MQIKRTENHVSEKPRKLARGIGFIGVHRKYVHSRAVGCAWRLNSTCKTTSWGPDFKTVVVGVNLVFRGSSLKIRGAHRVQIK